MGGWLGFGKARMSFDKVDGLWEPLTRLRFDTGSLVWMHLILSFDSLTVLLSPIPPPPPLRLKPVQSEDSTVSLSVVTSFTRLTASSQLHTRLECGSKRTSWANTRPPTLIGSSVTWVWLLHFSNPCSISCWSWAKTFLTFYQTAFPFFFLLFFFTCCYVWFLTSHRTRSDPIYSFCSLRLISLWYATPHLSHLLCDDAFSHGTTSSLPLPNPGRRVCGRFVPQYFFVLQFQSRIESYNYQMNLSYRLTCPSDGSVTWRNRRLVELAPSLAHLLLCRRYIHTSSIAVISVSGIEAIAPRSTYQNQVTKDNDPVLNSRKDTVVLQSQNNYTVSNR